MFSLKIASILHATSSCAIQSDVGDHDSETISVRRQLHRSIASIPVANARLYNSSGLCLPRLQLPMTLPPR